jgi:hypothetical protein
MRAVLFLAKASSTFVSIPNPVPGRVKWSIGEGLEDVWERPVSPPLGSLFTDEFRLDEAERACELFDRRKIDKGVFIFD